MCVRCRAWSSGRIAVALGLGCGAIAKIISEWSLRLCFRTASRQRAFVCFSDAGCATACRRLCNCLLPSHDFPRLLTLDANASAMSLASLAKDCKKCDFSLFLKSHCQPNRGGPVVVVFAASAISRCARCLFVCVVSCCVYVCMCACVLVGVCGVCVFV